LVPARAEPAIAIIGEAFAAYPEDAIPFGLRPDPFVQFAMNQFGHRLARIERARSGTPLQLDAWEEFPAPG